MPDTRLALPGLEGTNPVGFLAALGVLACLDRAGRSPRLWWTTDLVPTAVIEGPDSPADLLEVVDRDRWWWATESLTLNWGLRADVKASPIELHDWALAVRGAWAADPGDPWRRADVDLWSTLVAEGAAAGKGDAKPTHLHFTAGQQQFLVMARALANEVVAEQLTAALVGPRALDRRTRMPTFGWDAQSGDRVYALRADDPSTSKDKRAGEPGADWLALLGLSFLPVATRGARLRTTACDGGWKQGAFRWPLWSSPAAVPAVKALVTDPAVVGGRPDPTPGRRFRRRNTRELAARGVSLLLESPIRRTDQGGYGSFGAPAVLIDTSGVVGKP